MWIAQHDNNNRRILRILCIALAHSTLYSTTAATTTTNLHYGCALLPFYCKIITTMKMLRAYSAMDDGRFISIIITIIYGKTGFNGQNIYEIAVGCSGSVAGGGVSVNLRTAITTTTTTNAFGMTIRSIWWDRITDNENYGFGIFSTKFINAQPFLLYWRVWEREYTMREYTGIIQKTKIWKHTLYGCKRRGWVMLDER